MEPSSNTSPPARQPAPVVTAPMKNIPRIKKRTPQWLKEQLSNSNNVDLLFESMQQRINELEERLTTLENVLQVDGGDVVISATQSVLIQGQSSVEISGGISIKASATSYECSSSISRFSGVVQCDTLIANSVVSASYTPGAGNLR